MRVEIPFQPRVICKKLFNLFLKLIPLSAVSFIPLRYIKGCRFNRG